ncbi:MAG TPA: penicillin-binding transpeptidase domain-containing protein, partial [Polyangia bacterium]|nr:penicillin-binding transpeptidase domain-containing protein [Polyangia bacterium]
VDHVEAPDGQVLEQFPPRVRREIAVSPENLAFVRQALVGVVNEPKGTAYKVRSKDIEVAGKTGTAQVRGRGAADADTYDAATHAWFVGFAPAGRPKIALSVLVEHGGHGGDVAAPVAVEIIDNYFAQVAPGDKAAPRVGLPRRRGGGIIPTSDVEDVPPPPESIVKANRARAQDEEAASAPVDAAPAPSAPPKKPRPAPKAAAPLGEAPPMRLDFSKPDEPEAPPAEEPR